MRAGYRFALADDPYRLKAVHLGHLHVHQHDVEVNRVDRLDGVTTVRRNSYRMSEMLEHPHSYLLVDRMILGQQDSQPALRCSLPCDAGAGAAAWDRHLVGMSLCSWLS